MPAAKIICCTNASCTTYCKPGFHLQTLIHEIFQSQVNDLTVWAKKERVVETTRV